MKKHFLIGFAACAIVLTLCAAIVQNTYTTVTPGQFPSLLPAPSALSNWFVVIHTDGDGTVLESPKFTGINTNLNWNGRFGADTGAFTNGLTLNGVTVSTNSGAGGTTNYFNYIQVTNMTVLNSLTVSNISVTNVTVQNNLTVSNLYTVNGNHNTLIVTNALMLQTIKTNLLATDGNGVLTNAVYGTGISWDPTTRTLSSTGGGSTGSTNYRSAVVALTTTGTNVNANQIDFALTNQCYRLTLTNNAYFGSAVCTNVPATNFFQWVQLDLVQDATGNRLVQFDPTGWVGVNGTFAVTTNANAWDSATLINSRQTNGMVAFLPVTYLH